FIIRFSKEVKTANMSDDEFIHDGGIAKRKGLRLHAGYPFTQKISGNSRLEIVETGLVGNKKENSILMYSEITAKFPALFNGGLRIQVMDIPNFNSRLYTYQSSGAA